jgi:predicted amidohydrolase
VKVALVQMDLAWEDVAENHRRARKYLEEASRRGARLALLPEMFCTGFSMESEKIAQPAGGTSETFLRAAARELGISILASLPEAGTPRPRNMAILAGPDGSVARYAKIHPFSFGGEDRVYSGGDGIVTVPVEGARVTPFVCYDLRFPEPFRLAADDTDLFALVANWPEARRDHWRTLLRARAIENLCFVAGVNRVGTGGGLRYAGDSAVVSPWGDVLVEGSAEEAVLLCDVDPTVVLDARAKFPALRDRRPEAYRRLGAD